MPVSDMTSKVNGQTVENPLVTTLKQSIQSQNASERENVVRSLDSLLNHSDKTLSEFAYTSLKELAEDDSRRVSEAARKCLAAFEVRKKKTIPPAPLSEAKPWYLRKNLLLFGSIGMGGAVVLIGLLFAAALFIINNPLGRKVPNIGSASQAQSIIDQGDIYLMADNYDMAIDKYTEAIQTDPQNDEALSHRASALLEKGTTDPKAAEQAVTDYTKAIALNGRNTTAQTGLMTIQVIRGGWNNRGLILLINPFTRKPIRAPRPGTNKDVRTFTPSAFDPQIQSLVVECLQKRDPTACNNAAGLFISKGDDKNAAIMIGNARTLAPDNPTIASNSGWLNVQSGNYAQAEQDFQDAIDKDPNKPSAWTGMCWANIMKTPPDVATAEKACTTALNQDPERCSALVGLGMVNQTLGKAEAALMNCKDGQKCMERTFSANPSALEQYLSQYAHICQCVVNTDLGRYDDAIDAGNQAILISNQAPRILQQGPLAQQCINQANARSEGLVKKKASVEKTGCKWECLSPQQVQLPCKCEKSVSTGKTEPKTSTLGDPLFIPYVTNTGDACSPVKNCVEVCVPLPPTPTQPPPTPSSPPTPSQELAQNLDCRFKSFAVPSHDNFQITIDMPPKSITTEKSYTLITEDLQSIYPCKILKAYPDRLYCIGTNRLEGTYTLILNEDISATQGIPLCKITYGFPHIPVIPTPGYLGECYYDEWGIPHCPGEGEEEYPGEDHHHNGDDGDNGDSGGCPT